MTLFEYVSVAVSILLSLGMVHILSRIKDVLDPGRSYWIHTTHVGIVVVLLAQWRRPSPALCESCRFNDARHCRRPERPGAMECIGYENGPAPAPPRGQVVAFRPPPGEA